MDGFDELDIHSILLAGSGDTLSTTIIYRDHTDCELTQSKYVCFLIIKKPHICLYSFSMFLLILASHRVLVTEYEMNLPRKY